MFAKLLIGLLFVNVLFLFGCDDNKIMRERLGNADVGVVLTDTSTGEQYLVQHFMGANYHVTPLKSVNNVTIH